uniref:Molybdenum cofactor-like protein n=1 Tax=Philodina roseola TaxID=96448 RepID=B6S317_PHIRO|nr:molybdenum cofactor-like protein [Philodina roseola]
MSELSFAVVTGKKRFFFDAFQISNFLFSQYDLLRRSDSRSVGSGVDQILGRKIDKNVTLKNRSIKGEKSRLDVLRRQETLLKLCDELRPHLLLTTGGTGISPDDVTPDGSFKCDATRDVVTREIPGISQTMIAKSLSITPMAMLSRPVSGVCQQTLIINLPGSKKGCVECLDFVYPILRHAIDLIRNERTNVVETHVAMQNPNSKIYDSCCVHHQDHHVVQSDVVEGQRARHSPFPMISVDDAMTKIFNEISRMQIVEKRLTESLGFVCAEEIVAEQPFPPFRASVKDGYAVRLFADENHEQIYEIVGRSDAGGDEANEVIQTSRHLVSSLVLLSVPDTANAVIQIEDTKVHERHESEEKSIRITSKCVDGQDIRNVGDDVKIGEIVLEKETILGAAELALLATVGLEKVRVFDQPRVVVVSTGNEVLPIDSASTTSNGKIRDSNKIMLISALKTSKISSIIDGGTAKDDEKSVIETLENAFERGDLIISTGGVSMGDRDLIKSILTKHFKATIHFGRLNMKPGKPTTFATCEFDGKKKFFFGLPGNPVSALVTYWLLVVPSLKQLMGHNRPHHPVIRVQLDRTIERFDSRPEYIRVEIMWSTNSTIPLAKIISPANQCSSRLLSARRCNGLVRLPTQTEIDANRFERQQQQFDCLLLSL